MATAFGDRMRQLMTKRGTSLRELARRTHYDPGYLSKVSNSKEKPSVELATRLEQALDAAGQLAPLVPPRSGGGMPSVPPDADTLEWLRDALHVAHGTLHMLAPAAMIKALIRNVDLIRQIRHQANDQMRRDLLGTAAEYADLISALYQELADVQQTRLWIDRCSEWAMQAGQRYWALVVYTNSRQASLAWWQRDGQTTLDAAQAIRYAPGRVLIGMPSSRPLFASG